MRGSRKCLERHSSDTRILWMLTRCLSGRRTTGEIATYGVRRRDNAGGDNAKELSLRNELLPVKSQVTYASHANLAYAAHHHSRYLIPYLFSPCQEKRGHGSNTFLGVRLVCW